MRASLDDLPGGLRSGGPARPDHYPSSPGSSGNPYPGVPCHSDAYADTVSDAYKHARSPYSNPNAGSDSAGAASAPGPDRRA
jgi:hypothetical protein